MSCMTQTRPRKTIADLYRLPPETRAELIDGEIYVAPAPELEHQIAIGNLYVLLRRHVERRRLGCVYLSPLDVFLPTGEVVEPDLFFLSTRKERTVRKRVRVVPDLAVEVISPSGAIRDRNVKLSLYARSGVREYWIVDPIERTVEVFQLVRRRYEPCGYFRTRDRLSTPLFRDLRLPVRSIFRYSS